MRLADPGGAEKDHRLGALHEGSALLDCFGRQGARRFAASSADELI
jgi:hypothetical protein